ncbi:MAG: hypothetical protein GY854_17485 [Deltaproteobacteria bacterium]|nr:hypothetical protein [Deltaproteobacteria bacterium]
MKTRTCPTPVELTRELSLGQSAATQEHLEHCEHCAEQRSTFDKLNDLGRDLPGHAPSADKAEAIRAAVLDSFSEVPSTSVSSDRWRWVVGAIAAGIIVCFGIFYFPSTPSPSAIEMNETMVFKATVHSHVAAKHFRAGSQPDEIVRLTKGTITVSVEPLKKGERFRVVTGDAEVEVRGTVFDVVVKDDSLLEVNVISGEVEVRPAEALKVIIGPGERWLKPALQSSPEPLITDDSTAEMPGDAMPEDVPGDTLPGVASRSFNRTPRLDRPGSNRFASTLEQAHPETAAQSETDEQARAVEQSKDSQPKEEQPLIPETPAPPTPHPAELAFQKGWEALKQSAYNDAVNAFTVAINTPSAGRIAEDASFWRCVSHARAGQHARASRALSVFLETYPNSPRVGEASVMLGWKLLEKGNLDAAENHFQRATHDANPRIRTSAQQGLRDIETKRATGN